MIQPPGRPMAGMMCTLLRAACTMASHEAASHREAEAVQKMQCDNQPARLKRGVNYLLFRRLRAARQKVMQGRGGTTRGNATTSQQTRGKREEMHQQTKGDGALIGQGCVLRGGGRVKRMRGGDINTTTSQQTRDDRGGGKSDGNGNGDGDRKCR